MDSTQLAKNKLGVIIDIIKFECSPNLILTFNQKEKAKIFFKKKGNRNKQPYSIKFQESETQNMHKIYNHYLSSLCLLVDVNKRIIMNFVLLIHAWF